MKITALFCFSILFNFNLIAQLPGNVLELDGDGDWALTSTIFLTNLSSLTIESWVKAYSDGQVMSNHSPGSTWESVELSTVWFIINAGNGPGSRQILNFNGIVDSSWHHMAAVWDGNEMILYLDGVLFAGPEVANNPPWNSNVAIGIGSRRGQTSFLAGNIDELRVWNKPLSLEQILTNMNDTLSIEYYSTLDSGLIAYWRFDELEDLGVGNAGVDDVRDFSINSVHADLEGDASLTSSGVMNIGNRSSSIREYRLEQNYPNPFNPLTKIKYSVPQISNVIIKVFDILGNKIETLVNEEKSAGTYKITWYAEGLPSGIYFYKIQTGTFAETKKMVLMK
jgi:hypothetical protein